MRLHYYLGVILGTSSILSAACVKAVFEFMGIAYTEEDLYLAWDCLWGLRYHLLLRSASFGFAGDCLSLMILSIIVWGVCWDVCWGIDC